MIVYSATKAGFQDDIMSNNIGGIILDKFRDTTGKNTGVSEVDSWANSLPSMYLVLNDDAIPADSNISIEYHIPRTGKRIDFIITGLSHEKEESVIIIELKQWKKAGMTDKDAIVTTRFKHGEVETSHPSSVPSHKHFLENAHLRSFSGSMKPL